MIIKNWFIYIAVMIGLAIFAILYIKQSGFIVLFMAAVVPPLYSVVLYAAARRSVKVSFFQKMQSVEKGKKLPVTVCIESRGTISRGCAVVLFLKVNDGLGAYSNTIKKKIFLNSAREEILLFLDPKHCGFFEARVDKIICYHGFSLFRFVARPEAVTSFFVMPKYQEYPISFKLDGEEREGDSDCYSSVKAGNDPSELYDVRYYRPGDRLNCINWKLSAKKKEMIVQDYGFPIACDIAVLIDLMNERDADTIERAMEILYFTAMQMVMAGKLFYVIWKDGHEKKVTRKMVRDEEEVSQMLIEVLQSGMTKYGVPLEELYSAQFEGEYLFGCMFLYAGRKQMEDEVIRDRLRTNATEFVQVQKPVLC